MALKYQSIQQIDPILPCVFSEIGSKLSLQRSWGTACVGVCVERGIYKII